MQETILIVEDQASQRAILAHMCRHKLGYEVVEAANGVEGLNRFKSLPAGTISAVVTDLQMPGMDGKELLRNIKEVAPHTPVIVLTVTTELDSVVEIVRLGASDYIPKPVDAARLHVSIQNALQSRTLARELQRFRRKEQGGTRFEDMVGHAGGLAETVALARKLASADQPVLISGESGTGKELFARAIHGESKRSGRPFVAVNCGAIPEKLAESTLFGHERGAFTGAIVKSAGKFREATGGTLFLDEVGELPLATQVKLLRALQQKEIEPVGHGKPVKVDVRVISATNRKLADAVKAEVFRQDLYYRLNVLPLHLPPLRERSDDIPELAHYFLDLVCSTEQLPPRTLGADSIDWLQSQPWPGNVRELQNTMMRAAVLCSTPVISPADLETISGFADEYQERNAAPHPGPVAAEDSTFIRLTEMDGQPRTLQSVNDEIILRTLESFGKSVSKAAAALGVGQSTIYRRLVEIKQREPFAS